MRKLMLFTLGCLFCVIIVCVGHVFINVPFVESHVVGSPVSCCVPEKIVNYRYGHQIFVRRYSASNYYFGFGYYKLEVWFRDANGTFVYVPSWNTCFNPYNKTQTEYMYSPDFVYFRSPMTDPPNPWVYIAIGSGFTIVVCVVCLVFGREKDIRS